MPVRAVLAAILGLALALVGPTTSWAQDAPGTISGSVYLDSNGTGTPTGQGVANVAVTATAGGTTESRRTGSDGGFSFQLPPGRYAVTVHPPGDYRTTSDSQLSVVVNSRKTTGGVMFGLALKAKPTPTPTPKPAEPTVTPKPVESPAPRAQQERPAAAAPLLAPPSLFTPPSPSPTPESNEPVAPGPESAQASRASPTSGDDILAGRGVHWRLLDGSQALTANGPTASAPRSTRPVVTSLEALRRVSASQLQSWADDTTLWLGVPFRTQLDGTEFSRVNCGPTSLAMVLAAFGLEVGPASIRDYVNYLTGHYDPEEGTSLDVLAGVASEAGLKTFGLYGGGGYRAWTIDDVRQHVRAGHPVITLVKYRGLPGNGESLAEFDHYIVITGMVGQDLIYSDSAFSSEYGFNLLISPADLEQAWSFSSLPRHAVAIGLGDSLRPLPNAPRINAANLALGPESRVEPPLAMIPGPAALWLREKMLSESGVSALGQPVDAAAPPAERSAELLSTVREPGESDIAARPAEVETVARTAEPVSPDLQVLPPGALGGGGTSSPPSPDGPATGPVIYIVLLGIFAETLRRHRPALVVVGAELGATARGLMGRMPAVGVVSVFARDRSVPRAIREPMSRAWQWGRICLGWCGPAWGRVRPLFGWVRRGAARLAGMTPRVRLTPKVKLRPVPVPFRATLDRLWSTDRLAAIDEGVCCVTARIVAPVRRVMPGRRETTRKRPARQRRLQAVRGGARAPKALDGGAGQSTES